LLATYFLFFFPFSVFFLSDTRNPQADRQAADRAHRLGQTRAVLVLVLAGAGTVEEVILERAQAKRGLDRKIIQAGLFNQK
jgi:SNF2 family DNA or RNA helicase